jgi:hypothetical protein
MREDDTSYQTNTEQHNDYAHEDPRACLSEDVKENVPASSVGVFEVLFGRVLLR